MTPTTELYYGLPGDPPYHSFLDDHIVEGSSPPPQRMFGDPGVGNMYLGLSNLPSGSPGTPRETFFGKRVGVSRTFYNWSTADSSVSTAAGDIAQGRIPWVSFKLTGGSGAQNQTFAQFAASPQPWFAGMLADMDAIGKGPIVITLHHEPNGESQSGTDYKAMYAKAYAMMAPYPQLLLAPIIAAGYYFISQPGGPHTLVSDWMDPDFCDIFGIDCYNPWYQGGSKPWSTVTQAFAQGGVEACRALDSTKPIAIGEWGVHVDPANVGKAAAYILEAISYCRSAGVVMSAYFDSGVGATGGPWILDQTPSGTIEPVPERLNAFKTAVLDSHSVSIGPGGIPAP